MLEMAHATDPAMRSREVESTEEKREAQLAEEKKWADRRRRLVKEIIAAKEAKEKRKTKSTEEEKWAERKKMLDLYMEAKEAEGKRDAISVAEMRREEMSLRNAIRRQKDAEEMRREEMSVADTEVSDADSAVAESAETMERREAKSASIWTEITIPENENERTPAESDWVVVDAGVDEDWESV